MPGVVSELITRAASLGIAALILSPVQGSAQDMEGALGELIENVAYEAEGGAVFFHRNYAGDARDIHDPVGEAWTRVSASTDAELAEGVLFRLAGFAVISTIRQDYRGVVSLPEHDRMYGKHADFTELSLTYEADDYELVAGKASISVGLSTLYSPANLYSNYEAVNPLYTEDLGAWHFGGTYFFDDDALSIFVLPFDTRSPTAPLVSRWYGESGSSSFFSLDLPAGTVIAEEFRSPKLDDWGALAVYNGVGEGFDYFVSGHHGPSAYPVLRVQLPGLMVMEYPTATTLSGGFTATVEAWEFHGEASYQDTHSGRDQDFIKYVVGFAYRETDDLAPLVGLEEIMPILEWAREWVSLRQKDPEYFVDSSRTRPFPNAFIGRVLLKRDDELSYVVAATYNNRYEDWNSLVGLEYKPDDNMTISASLAGFWGPSATQLGRWRRNNFLHIGLKRKF